MFPHDINIIDRLEKSERVRMLSDPAEVEEKREGEGSISPLFAEDGAA